jgi:phenylpropionate dioxygenase-like ring-hydroxylating dioxygenase large terminal subunit
VTETGDITNRDQTEIPRGNPIPPQGEAGGYDQCWYPICLSAEVETGQVTGRGFLNGRVIVYRGEDGEASVLSAYCRHVGASLEVGSVEGNDIRCRFHHWSYDRTGKCVHIAAGDTVPTKAQLFRFPAHEAMGVIWAFNGHEPLYDPPQHRIPPEELESTAILASVHPAEPYMLLSNSMDFQHLEVVHGMTIHDDALNMNVTTHNIEYALDADVPGMGSLRQHIKVFGTNCITISTNNMGRDMFMMSCAVPEPGGKCRNYNVNATPKGTGDPEEQAAIDGMLKAAEEFGLRLIEEDTPIVDTMSFRPDVLTSSDRALHIWFEHVRKYPRANPAGDLICRQRSTNGSGS